MTTRDNSTALPFTSSYPNPLYYDSSGVCYSSITPVAADRVAVVEIESEKPVVSIRFLQTSTNSEQLSSEITQVTITPAHAGAAVWSTRLADEVSIDFPVPDVTAEEWIWDFQEGRKPAPLILKVKVKRP